MKIFNLCLRLFVLVLFPLFFYQPAYADGLPIGSKWVTGFIKFEGWENVKDYLIVQPT